MEAFLRGLLNAAGQRKDLGVREIRFDIVRHPRRDAGMLQSGAELARMRKKEYRKAVLMWDHHGSGREHKGPVSAVEGEMQGKMDRFSWENRSVVIAVHPELERWLWCCEAAIAEYFGISGEQLQQWSNQYARERDMSADVVKTERPKELFDCIRRKHLRWRVSPRDFEKIGGLVRVKDLQGCDSFRRFSEALRGWFPVRGA